MKEQVENWKAILKLTSDQELAIRLGMSLSAISQWKSGKTKPSRLALNSINALLKKGAKS
jgi:DNA-binding transcriptional regulator YiaG